MVPKVIAQLKGVIVLIRSLLILTVLLQGCGIVHPAMKRESKLARLDLNMSPDQTRAIFGDPDRVRAAGQRNDGKFVKLWEYKIYGNYRSVANGLLCPITILLSCFWEGNFDTLYWLQFVDGKLERWGRAGDWQADIVDINLHQKDK